MATILNFPNPGGGRRKPRAAQPSSGEVVLFLGVRYEYEGSEPAPSSRPGRPGYRERRYFEPAAE